MSGPSKDAVSVRLYGPNVTREVVDEAGGHLLSLMRELTRAQCGDADALSWKLDDPRRVCDGCDSNIAWDGSESITVDSLDFCAACQLSFVPVAE